MSDNLKDAAESGFRIYGEKIQAPFSNEDLTDLLEAYASRILASQQAAHDAEIARLKEENELYHAEMSQAKEAGWYSASELFSAYNTLERKLTAANAACAMKDEALKANHEWHKEMDEHEGYPDSELCEINTAAISVSPRQVAEWERKQLDPLRSHVATLRESIKPYLGQHDRNGNYDKLYRIFHNTQATAEQFISECEQRGAVKALEDAAESAPDDCSERYCRMRAESIRATSKKAG